MAVQSITPAAHPAESTEVQTDMTTLTATGSGNGFQFTYAQGYLVVLHNDTGSGATVTFKVSQPTAYSDRSLTIPDETATIANGETDTWIPVSIFNDGGNVTIEADQLIKIKVFTQLTRS